MLLSLGLPRVPARQKSLNGIWLTKDGMRTRSGKRLTGAMSKGTSTHLKLAIAVIEHRMGRQKMGRLRVISELRQRGVNSEWIEEALRRFEENDEEEEWERAMAVARKKWASRYKNREEQKRRTGMYLLRRGFESELVIKILEKLENEM